MKSLVPRYSRHILLKVIGEEGQKKIEQSRVLVCRGRRAGISRCNTVSPSRRGFSCIVDQDSPELHNLHRQILYDEADVESGLSKAEAAALHLRAANSSVEIDVVSEAIGPENVEALCTGVDLVVDALDNIRTRYLINDVILDRGIPYVFGGAVETVGNIMTIIPGKTPCLRCLWPDPAAVDDHPGLPGGGFVFGSDNSGFFAGHGSAEILAAATKKYSRVCWFWMCGEAASTLRRLRGPQVHLPEIGTMRNQHAALPFVAFV